MTSHSSTSHTPRKLYVLDTNVLIHDPQSIFAFKGAEVGIPITVLEELDKFKSDNSQRGFSAREAIRILDRLRDQGSLRDGVHLKDGSNIQVLTHDPREMCSKVFGEDTPDNRILSVALCAQHARKTVELITKDINMRVKADSVGIPSIDYLKDVVAVDEFYYGWRTIQVPAVELKQSVPDSLQQLAQDNALIYNEYFIVEANHNPHNHRLFRYTAQRTIEPVHAPSLNWNFEARNLQQVIALDLLFNDQIPIVTLSGPAGTGKTLLILIAALYKVLVEEVYTKALISRPIIPLGPDIGYLPGELQEKLYNWMQPVYDNMELIAHLIQGPESSSPHEHHKNCAHHNHNHWDEDNQPHRRKHKRHSRSEENHGTRPPRSLPSLRVEQLINQGKLSLEAITYMRGRSIPYRYIFIDEVQNLTPHEVKTIVSRVGEGSKIVLAGDPYQIDSPYLDFSSNGLMVLTERFKNQPIFGTVFLQHSERSPISKLASELL
jgi:PhoH-like ATPase